MSRFGLHCKQIHESQSGPEHRIELTAMAITTSTTEQLIRKTGDVTRGENKHLDDLRESGRFVSFEDSISTLFRLHCRLLSESPLVQSHRTKSRFGSHALCTF